MHLTKHNIIRRDSKIQVPKDATRIHMIGHTSLTVLSMLHNSSFIDVIITTDLADLCKMLMKSGRINSRG